MENFRKNIDGIRKMMKDLKPEKYAIVNSELIKLDEFVKELYLKILCTAIQYENDPTDMQVLFLKRIISGLDVDGVAEEYMKRALEISNADVQDFLSIASDSEIKYYFATDGLLLVSMGNGGTDGYEYLAEWIELLGMNKDDLEYVCTVVKSVLQQDSSYYDQARGLINERVAKLNFTPYVQNYYAGAIIDTDTEKYYSAPDKKLSSNIQYNSLYKERKVTFENVEIDMNADFKFEGCEEVVFRNCTLNGKGGKLRISSVGTFRVVGCRISEFDHGFACLNSVNNILVQQCEIIGCGRTDESGGVITCEGNNCVEMANLKGNTVRNCYIKKSWPYYSCTGAFIYFYPGIDSISVENNEFIGCKGSSLIGWWGVVKNITSNGNKCSGELLCVFADSNYENNFSDAVD